jgi:hypothetical protein
MSVILNLSKGVVDCLAQGTGSDEALDVRNRLRVPIAHDGVHIFQRGPIVVQLMFLLTDA